jgi:hypothetical protein
VLKGDENMRKHNIDEVRQEFDERDYTLLEDEYHNNSTPMKYICRKHADKGVLKITYGNFHAGKGCPYCGGERSWQNRNRHDIAYIREEFNKRGYTLLDDKYIRSNAKLRYRCNKHPEKELAITWNNFQRGKGCRYCAIEERAKKKRMDINIIKQECEKRGYDYINSYYIESVLYIEYICRQHTSYGIQRISWSNLKSGRGCKYCQDSKGEMMVYNILKDNDIEFYTQWSFDGCEYHLPLKFDFWLPSYKCAIEYDGEQHFKPVQFGGISFEEADERFHDTQIRDGIKNQYCKHHDIDLLRIPYWEKDNIAQILYDKLNIY